MTASDNDREFAVFRRRQRQEPDPAVPGPAGTDVPEGEDGGPGAAGHREPRPRGPWDAGGDVPEADRIDFGSLRVPVAEGTEIQVSMADDQAAWVTVVRGTSGLQLQAFAAPKSGGLWQDVREEIAAEITKAGGDWEEAEGPFGAELRARIVPAEPVQGAGRGARQPVRFLGVDGPRWFLRGVISGPAARRAEDARPLEEVFAGVVVVRGDHPAPPRDLLEIQLPEQARQALAEQAEEQEAAARWALGPFERGPEITETR
jgi:Protein of unknown function (DUF3710)